MADNEKSAPERVVYVKGDRVAVATTKAKAVALEFDGYVKADSGEAKVEDAPEGVVENANPDAPTTDDDDSGTPAGVPALPSPSRVFGRP